MTFAFLILIGVTAFLFIYFGFIIWQTQKEFDKIQEEYEKNKQDMSWIHEEMDKLKEEQKKNKK